MIDMINMKGSKLFKQMIAVISDSEKTSELMKELWSPTPWMIDAFTDSNDSERYREILDWCHNKWGRESNNVEDRNWRVGGATVYGYTWYGFKTKQMMNEFIHKWSE